MQPDLNTNIVPHTLMVHECTISSINKLDLALSPVHDCAISAINQLMIVDFLKSVKSYLI